LFFHKTKRSRRRMDVDRSEFIRDRHFGVHTIVHVMNLWRVRLAAHPDCFWLRYEEMKTQLDQELLRLLSFLGIDNPNPQHIAEAVAWADFENMKKMEATDAFGSHKLRPRDVSDPDSYKVREGRVGGYRKHFGPDDLRYLDEAVAMLDPFYGYRCASAER